MFDKELFDKICNVTCTFDELKNFTVKISEQQFDLDNAFEKYYSLDRILLAIEKYQKQEIDDKFLACWANAYNWIIRAGFESSPFFAKGVTIKEILIEEISDWLDSLSFFEEEAECFIISEYIEVFSSLNTIYQNLDEWCFDYAQIYEFDEEYGDVTILFVNEQEKKYLNFIFVDCGKCQIVGKNACKDTDIESRIQSLKNSGYQEMPFGESDIE